MISSNAIRSVLLLLFLSVPLSGMAGKSSSSGASSRSSGARSSPSSFGSFGSSRSSQKSTAPAAAPSPAPSPASFKSNGFSSGFGSASRSSSAASPAPVQPTDASPKVGGLASGFGVSKPALVGAGAAGVAGVAVAGPSSSATASTSALSQSLDKSASQTAAMKNWDARDAKSNASMPSTPPPPTSSIQNGSVNTGGYAPSYGSSGYANPAPIIVQNNSSAFGSSGMGNLMWFMMGQSWGHRDRPVYVNQAPPGAYNNEYSNGNSNVPVSGNSAIGFQGQAMPQRVPEPTSHWFLRALMWLMVIGVIVYAVKLIMGIRRKAKESNQTKRNYSL